FFAVYTGVKNLRSEAAFVTWLFSIANNTALRHWERQKKHARLQLVSSRQDEVGDEGPPEVDKVAARDPDPLSQLLNVERVQALSNALRMLPDRERDCLKASLVESLTHKEIGQRLGISENTVSVHVHRAMKALKGRLKTNQQ
ncbi:MAG: RNA polymerase sigma factor, partial [Blastocatellia bacterium]